ncbi:protein of unknown function [Paraburkholderia dioscoreae]|uniref:Uncharacterized protein n=1 Tax=Paraburkholderia dioscoreae TaxID=2604047 RepID=A0A5Q4ZD83_9BURK|nr:protein of unknown function [Paraburkholderia dioscoreae]
MIATATKWLRFGGGSRLSPERSTKCLTHPASRHYTMSPAPSDTSGEVRIILFYAYRRGTTT